MDTVNSEVITPTKLHSDIQKIEKSIFYFLCGYALFSSTSIAIGNVFLSLTILGAVVRLIKKHDDWRQLIQVDKVLAYPFLIYVGICLITSLFATDPIWSLRVMGDHYLYRMTALYVVLAFVKDKKQILALFKIALLSFMMNNVVVIYQGLIEQDYRSSGIIGAMMTGGMLSMWIPVLFCMLLSQYSEKNIYYIFEAIMFISLVALLFNGTRGAWIAVLITCVLCLLIGVKSRIKLISILLAMGVMMGIVVINVPQFAIRVQSITNISGDSSNRERILLWNSSIDMVNDYPITGVGYGNFGVNYQEKYILPEAIYRKLGHAHSNFFQNLGETGIPGAVAFIIWICGTCIFCYRRWTNYSNIGYLCLLAIFLGIHIQGLTEYTMGDSIVMKLCWFGIGLVYQHTTLTREQDC